MRTFGQNRHDWRAIYVRRHQAKRAIVKARREGVASGWTEEQVRQRASKLAKRYIAQLEEE